MNNYLEAQKAFTEAYMYNYGDLSLEKLNEIEHEKLKVEIEVKKFSPEVYSGALRYPLSQIGQKTTSSLL
jgi:hypothetical protein